MRNFGMSDKGVGLLPVDVIVDSRFGGGRMEDEVLLSQDDQAEADLTGVQVGATCDFDTPLATISREN